MKRRSSITIAVVRSESQSVWKSCNSIIRNLEAAYAQAVTQDATLEVKLIKIGKQMPSSQRLSAMVELASLKPEVVAVIDDAAYPSWFMEEVALKIPELHDSRFLIHCFGDFYHYARAWMRLEGFLRGKRVDFLAASHKSARMINRLLQNPTAGVCPFPVNEKEFHWSASERKHRRKMLGLSDRDIFLLYSGRLSVQKNISELLKMISIWAGNYERSGRRMVLGLAGGFDHVGTPHFGKDLKPGDYEIFIRELLHHVNQESSFEAQWLGDMNATDLRQTLNAADVFTSVSLHHNEDYGMAVAEALLTGLPLLLSDWGGYSSFAAWTAPGASRLIPVRRAEKNMPYLELDAGDMQFVESHALSGAGLVKMRAQISKLALEKISIRGVAHALAERLHAGVKEEFQGFSGLMGRLGSFQYLDQAFEERKFADPVFSALYEPYFTS